MSSSRLHITTLLSAVYAPGGGLMMPTSANAAAARTASLAWNPCVPPCPARYGAQRSKSIRTSLCSVGEKILSPFRSLKPSLNS